MIALQRDAQGVWRMDFADMEKKLKEQSIHAAVFCSPHNPCGRVWERWELEEAMALFKKYDKGCSRRSATFCGIDGAVAKFMSATHMGIRLNPSFTVLGGVVSALNVFCSRGDKVLLHSPTYVGFADQTCQIKGLGRCIQRGRSHSGVFRY